MRGDDPSSTDGKTRDLHPDGAQKGEDCRGGDDTSNRSGDAIEVKLVRANPIAEPVETGVEKVIIDMWLVG